MAKLFVAKIACAILLLSFGSVASRADDKSDDKSYSTFINYIKSNYHARGQSAFGMISLARFVVKVIKPAGVKNFKLSMLRDLQFTTAKVDEDLGAFIRKNVHPDWHRLSQIVSLKEQQYIYVYFMQEKENAKFLVVAVQKQDAFVIQFKFEPERLAKFLEKPEIMGIPLSGDTDKNKANAVTDAPDPNAEKKTEEQKKPGSNEGQKNN